MHSIPRILRIIEPGPAVHNRDGALGRVERGRPGRNGLVQVDNPVGALGTVARVHGYNLRNLPQPSC